VDASEGLALLKSRKGRLRELQIGRCDQTLGASGQLPLANVGGHREASSGRVKEKVERGKPYKRAAKVDWSFAGKGFEEKFLAMSTLVPSIITLPPGTAADQVPAKALAGAQPATTDESVEIGGGAKSAVAGRLESRGKENGKQPLWLLCAQQAAATEFRS
jgi:hypothetical protein